MRHLFSRFTVYIYTFFIFLFSILPVSAPSVVASFDKIIHFFIYGLLSFMVVNSLLLRKKKNPFAIGFFYAFSVGFAIEIIQIFIPYRSFELLDVASNSLGIIVGTLIKVV